MARKLRVGFVYHWPADPSNSITRKALDQLAAWNQNGAEARMFALAADGRFPYGAESLKSATFLPRAGRAARFLNPGRLTQQILAFDPDVIYARFSTFYPYMTSLAKRCPLILELNTDDRTEIKLTSSKPVEMFHLMTRDRVLSRAAGFVSVTSELVRNVLPPHSNSVVIPNGIALSDVDPLPPPSKARPRLVFVGSPNAAWQGPDELVSFAASKPEWDFDVIGSRVDEVAGIHPPNLTCRGYLPPEQYRHILENADVAFGTLALYRKEMEEACPLKVREYLKFGLPVIIGYEDSDFSSDEEFLLRIPNVSGNLQSRAKEITAFVDRWKGHRVPRAAVAHLDSSVKERARLDFMQKVADSWRQNHRAQ